MPKLNKWLWALAISSISIFLISFTAENYSRAGGEPYFPLYVFVWQNLILLQLTVTISSIVASFSLVYLLVLKIQKIRNTRPVREFTKENKYRRILTQSLWLAAIPGLVLLPFVIGGLLTLLGGYSNPIIGSIINLSAMLTGGTLLPGAGGMFALLVLAIITATQKPTDPDSPPPKTLLAQIVLAAITAAMPAIAFITIFLTSFEECEDSCTIVDNPIVPAAGYLYLALWVVQTTIWLRNRNKLAK
jgi:hypothetical protein